MWKLIRDIVGPFTTDPESRFVTDSVNVQGICF